MTIEEFEAMLNENEDFEESIFDTAYSDAISEVADTIVDDLYDQGIDMDSDEIAEQLNITGGELEIADFDEDEGEARLVGELEIHSDNEAIEKALEFYDNWFVFDGGLYVGIVD